MRRLRGWLDPRPNANRMSRACCYVALVAAGQLVLAGCSSEDAEPESARPAVGLDEPKSEDGNDEAGSKGQGDEPYAVPEEVDEAYAEEVINVLLKINSDALRIVLEQQPGESIAPEAADRIKAIAAGGRLDFLLDAYQRYIDHPELAHGFLPTEQIGTSRFEAHGILHAEPEACILAVGWWDTSEVVEEPPDEQSLISLGPIGPEITDDRNPTPWQIRELSPMLTNGEPIPEDRWDDIDFGDELDRTCEER
jgi:hypothetical protein